MTVHDLFFSRTKHVPTEELAGTLSQLPFGPALPTPTARYGFACVAAERARRSTAVLTDLDPVWEHLLGSLASPGPWERGEPMFGRIRSSNDAPKLWSILDFGQCGLGLARIRPIGAQGARALSLVNIHTPNELLACAADPASRAALADATQLDKAKVEAWAHLAEVAVVLELAYESTGGPPRPVGDLVSLAALATIRDVKTMASVDPSIVASAMERANREKRYVTGLGATDFEDIVVGWKAGAVKWLSHVGREGATSMIEPSPPAPRPEPGNGKGPDEASVPASPPE